MKAIVTLPNGTKKEVSGDSRDEIMAKVARLEAEQKTPSPSVGQGVAQGAAESLAGIPSNLLEFGARAARGGSNLIRAGTGQDMIPIPPEGLLGLPGGREVLSGVEAGAGALGGLFDPSGPPIGDRFQQAMQRRNEVQEGAPIAHIAGELLSEAGQLALGRVPFVKGPGGVFDKPVKEGLDRVGTKLLASNQPGMRNFTGRILKDEEFQKLARGAGRIAETGIEGAALSVLQGGDPVETAVFSAALQGGGSVGLSVAEAATKYPLKWLIGERKLSKVGAVGAAAINMGIVAGSISTLLQGAKALFPGGRDRILESEESGFRKVAYGLVLGTLIGVTGKRTTPGNMVENFPKFMDVMTTTFTRGPALAALRDALDNPETEAAVQRIAENPEAFTKQQLDKFQQGFENQKLKSAIDELLEDEDFRKKIDAPHPSLADVPVKGE